MRLVSAFLILLLPNIAPAQDFTGTLAHIAETGEITIGYRTSRPPLSFADASGLPSGYSVDICNRIAEDVATTLGRDDIDVSYVPVDVQDRFDAIENGTIDILCGATTKTLSRAEQVGFTQLTFATGGTLLSMDSARVDRVNDLGGKRVAVSAGTTTEGALRSAVAQTQVAAEIVTVSSADEGMAALKAGEVAAFASDQIVLIGQVVSQTDPNARYYLSSALFSFEPYALAIRRGDADFALVADRTISRMFRSKEITGVYNKHLGPYGLKPPNALLALYELMSTPE